MDTYMTVDLPETFFRTAPISCRIWFNRSTFSGAEEWPITSQFNLKKSFIFSSIFMILRFSLRTGNFLWKIDVYLSITISCCLPIASFGLVSSGTDGTFRALSVPRGCNCFKTTEWLCQSFFNSGLQSLWGHATLLLWPMALCSPLLGVKSRLFLQKTVLLIPVHDRVCYEIHSPNKQNP